MHNKYCDVVRRINEHEGSAYTLFDRVIEMDNSCPICFKHNMKLLFVTPKMVGFQCVGCNNVRRVGRDCSE